MNLLTAIAFGIQVFILAALLTNRIRYTAGSGLMGTAFILLWINHLLEGDHLWAGVDAGLASYFVREWWRGGGGGNTRRRLRRLRRTFRATRRTAPTSA